MPPKPKRRLVPELLRKSAFSFVGTVERLGASTMTDVPIDNHTAVVRVDQVLHAPDAFTALAGTPITVQLAAKPALPKEGEQDVFFTNGVAFGASIAVAEVGRLPASAIAPHMARAAAGGGGTCRACRRRSKRSSSARMRRKPRRSSSAA